jgi:hypothetical protein
MRRANERDEEVGQASPKAAGRRKQEFGFQDHAHLQQSAGMA